MNQRFRSARSQLTPLNQAPLFGQFNNPMPYYGQPMFQDPNVTLRRHQQLQPPYFQQQQHYPQKQLPRPQPKPRKFFPKARQQQPTTNTNDYSKIIEASLEFCQTDECGPAAKKIITLLTSLLEASSNNNRSSSSDPVEEHRRQRSVVIANMPESENASAQARVREDTKNIKDLFDQLDIEVAPITVYRMGKTGDKPRLLKVELPTRQHTRRILQTKKHLANHQKFASVRIRASMTPEERAHRADLIKKCNEMRASDPTADLVIWRGEIVSRALIRDKLEEEKANAGTKL